MNKPSKIIPVAVLFLSLFFVSRAARAVSCTNIVSDLSYGMTDSVSSGPILSLQNFLSAQGYLSATPNGHFGPATAAAVVAFQVAHKISGTGYVGSVTRAAINAASCSTTAVTASTSASSTTTATNASASVTAPRANASLLIGQTYTITWNGTDRQGYSIVLEDANGLSEGYVTPISQSSGSFSWQVGTVLSGITDTYTTVPTGTYQIHLRSSSGDIYSGQFNISAPALSVGTIMPLSFSSLAQNPTMVIYGSGLNSSARVNIDGSYNFSGTNLYASPDGTVLVFSVPSGLSVGQHSADVSNAYGSLAVSPTFNVTQ